MTLARQNDFDRVQDLLTWLQTKVIRSNQLNLTDVNNHAEDFYRDFLNKLFGWELKNLNIVEGNFPAVDLGDPNRRIALQVTSTASIGKITYTVQKFVKKGLNQKFDRLIILRIGKHVKHRVKYISDSENIYQLITKKDVWDLDRILKEIKNQNAGKVADIREFLEKEIRTHNPSTHHDAGANSPLAQPLEIANKAIMLELDLIKKSRFFTDSNIEAKAQSLSHRIISGDLQFGSTEVCELGLNWCARFLSTSNPERAVEILNTCIVSKETEEHILALSFANYKTVDVAEVLSKIAVFHSPLSNSASLYIKSFESSDEETLIWFEQSGYSVAQLDGDGKFKYFQLCFSARDWGKAISALSRVSDLDLEDSPALNYVIASLYLLQTVPAHYRSQILNQVPFHLADFPIQTTDMERANLVSAALHFDKYELVAQGYGLINAANIASDFSLWVKLRNPDSAKSAILILKEKLRDGKNALRYANFALQFGVEIDVISLEQQIDQQTIRTGKISPEGAVARFALVFRQQSQTEALDYITKHRDNIIQFISPYAIAMLEIELMCQLGRVEDAKVSLSLIKATERNPELEAIAQRLIESVSSTNPVAIRIEEYENTKSPDSLNNLTIMLEEENNWVQLAIFSEKLFQKLGTLEALQRRALALHNLGQDNKLMLLLNDNRELVRQSNFLKKIEANSLFNLGNLNDSWAIISDLLEGVSSEHVKKLAIHVSIASGNWGWINTIIENDWRDRSNRTDIELLQSAQFAHIISSSRSKEFLIEATDKTKSDANVFLIAYNIATSEGWENEPCAKDWLPNALKYSDKNGPIQRMTLTDIVSRSPDWEDHRKSIMDKLRKSEIPLFLAAQELNRSLSEMYLVQSLANQKLDDVRSKSIVRAFSPKRGDMALEAKSIGLDATALLTLGMVGVFEELDSAFEKIVVPHSTLSWLLNERQRVMFHQPSRLKRASEISRLVQLGKLKQFIEQIELEPDLTVEVGRDFAFFLQQANTLNSDTEQHLVVRPSTVYRAGSLMDEAAEISEFQDILISCSDIVSYLAKNAFLTEAESKKARAFLESQNDLELSGNTLKSGANLYIDDVAVSYFQTLNMLEKISDAGFCCYISDNELNEIQGLLQYEKYSCQALEVIEAIRVFLANGIENGKVEIGPRPRNANSDNLELISHPTVSIMDIAFSVDAIVVDDAFLNQHQNINLAANLTPIFTSLDVLKRLYLEEHLSEMEYYEFKTRIRNSGYSAIPVSENELVLHLNKSTITDGVVDENAELKAIRKNLLHLQMFAGLNMPDDFSYLVNLQRVFRSCIIRLWNEGDTIETIQARSNWLLEFTDFRHWAYCYSYEIGSTLASVSLETNAQSFMSSSLIESDERQASYNAWFEKTVLEPLKHIYPDTYDRMLGSLERSLIEVSSKSLEDFNNEA